MTFLLVTLDEEAANAMYITGKVTYKGKGIRSIKDLFLVSPFSHPHVPSDFF